EFALMNISHNNNDATETGEPGGIASGAPQNHPPALASDPIVRAAAADNMYYLGIALIFLFVIGIIALWSFLSNSQSDDLAIMLGTGVVISYAMVVYVGVGAFRSFYS